MRAAVSLLNGTLFYVERCPKEFAWGGERGERGTVKAHACLSQLASEGSQELLSPVQGRRKDTSVNPLLSFSLHCVIRSVPTQTHSTVAHSPEFPEKNLEIPEGGLGRGYCRRACGKGRSPLAFKVSVRTRVGLCN